MTKKQEEPIKNRIFNRSKIYFEFSRLSFLLFRIEDFEKAKKIALFELTGTSVLATILPEINYLETNFKVKGLKVSDLKQVDKETANNKCIFGIGLQNETEAEVFEIIYKKFKDDRSSKRETSSELKIQMASLCYLHSPEFIFEVQSCMNDFLRFQAKVIKKLTEKAASLAVDLFKKGKKRIEFFKFKSFNYKFKIKVKHISRIQSQIFIIKTTMINVIKIKRSLITSVHRP